MIETTVFFSKSSNHFPVNFFFRIQRKKPQQEIDGISQLNIYIKKDLAKTDFVHKNIFTSKKF